MDFIKINNDRIDPIWPDEIARALVEEDPEGWIRPEENEPGEPTPDPATYNPYLNFLHDKFVTGWDSLYLQQFRPTSPCGCGREFPRANEFVDHAEDCLQAPEYRYEPAFRAIFTRRQYLAMKSQFEGGE
ncbi:hypothetical protein OG785_33335 [Streptomyces sp. NBC_00006]|uniref:hypothetical protein n=1 Tax=Streptomyces sp. NBC_00006 TaxID=2975619 RepID=UPI0022515E1C|nr:hypothetical protein [Streptomyces sp. NBC_00006]MCX5535423.1 hypothetical protein [Streptomyces sp. NBC_00006]